MVKLPRDSYEQYCILNKAYERCKTKKIPHWVKKNIRKWKKELEPISKRLRKRPALTVETSHEKKYRVLGYFKRKENLSFYKSSYRQASSSTRIRNLLTKEQGGKCPGLIHVNGHVFKNCGSLCLEDCDHMIELRYRGIDYKDNLQMLCYECHKTKTRYNAHGQTLI